MAIIRTKRTKNFTVLNNDLIRDSRLSFKARGLLQYMLSMPDDWKFYVSELAKHSSKEGESAIRSGIEELEKLGYMRRIQNRDKSGKFGSVDWEVLDEPVFSPHVEKPQADKPNAEKPRADNRPLLRTNGTKNLSNKEPKMIDDDRLRADLDIQLECHRNIQPIVQNFERNFGQISASERTKLIDEYRDWHEAGVTNENIIAVFNNVLEKAAIYRAKAPASYMVGILKGWLRNKIWTVEAIEGEEKQYKAKKQQRRQNNSYTKSKPTIERDLSNKHYGTDEELEAEFFGEA